MASVYELFLRRVAEGRALPVDLIRAVAEGRIWSGTQGLKIRLVDEIGGLGKALDVARKLASLDADIPVRVEGLSESFLENLLLDEDADEATVRAAMVRAAEQPGALETITAPLHPFIAALSPLVTGETTVAALPFALVVK
jgi:protease-4